MPEYAIQPLKYQELPGLSARQLAEHHDVLYAGYVKKVNEIRAALAGTDASDANATFSAWRELKIEEGFAVNGVKLHESYFENLTASGTPCDGMISAWIGEDFGSREKWAVEFAACGLAARGWTVLTFDFKDGKLHNYVCDIHNQGGVWGALPLMVLDVYEHAYFLDYATARKKYIAAFMANLDWRTANALIEKYELKKYRAN